MEFREFVDLPITSGVFLLDAEVLLDDHDASPRSFGAIVREDDRLAIYAVSGGYLVGVWDTPTVTPNDSVRVRLLQGGTSAGVVYVLPPDAPTDGHP